MDRMVQMEIIGFVGAFGIIALLIGQIIVAGTAVGILGGLVTGKTIFSSDEPANGDQEEPEA